ncbi:polysaccharide pyruvyl transferase family protein [Oerskovia turbata]
MQRRVIYLVGVAGNPNYGDELIARTWLSYLAEHHPDADVWFDTPHPGPASTLLAGQHPRLHVTDTIWRLRDLSEQFASPRTTMIQALSDPGHAPWWTAGIDVLRSADVVHIVGGGFLNDLWPANLAVVAGVGSLALNHGTRVALSGAGLTPVTGSDRRWLVEDLAAFQVVDVRDVPSFEALSDGDGPAANVRRTADDVFLGDPYSTIDASTADLFDVGIVLQDDLVQIDKDALRLFVKQQVESWGTSPDRIAFIECIPRIDASSAADLGADWPGSQFYSFQHLWEHGFPAGPHQRWISTRFHPHLIAASVGARGIALSVHADYYAAKHGSLTALGSGWEIVDAELTPPRSLSMGTLAERAKGLRRAKQDVAQAIYGEPDHRSEGRRSTVVDTRQRRLRTFAQRPLLRT